MTNGTNGTTATADLKTLKGVSERDRQMIADSEALLGVQPEDLGPMKSLFWGRLRDDLLFPYPPYDAEEHKRCDELLEKLGRYLDEEHPSVAIDQDQEIPQAVVDKLFELGVMGMTIPREHGGGGFGITSYNRALERIGRACGSTAVMVSAHQSIGCKAVMLFGNDEQKKRWLPRLANDWLSAFCLSEPNVGCDAGGQETIITRRDDGSYVVNGEKKWSTSGALAGLFTVMGKQDLGDGKRKVSAVVVTPDMPGVEIFQKNRSKCGIRGTWQARIRFNDVVVPAENLLHEEGKGLTVALSCLNYGRCTLSAGMLGGARRAAEQAYKWARHRRQFNRALIEFELVREKVARMSAYCYAMDALLYATTGFLDRRDDDIQLETAACKVFCSEIGWRTVNDAMQIMGGEGYMTENEVERIFRDSRINTIVEGANEVMQSYIFGYGGRALAEHMLTVKNALGWDGDEGLGGNLKRIFRNGTKGANIKAGVPLATQVFLGIRQGVPHKPEVHAELGGWAEKLAEATRQLSHEFKLAAKREDAAIVGRQVVQARIADAAIWIHAWACTLSKIDRQLCRQRSDEAMHRPKQEKDRAAAEHFMALAEQEVHQRFAALYDNADATLDKASAAAMAWSDGQPDEDYYLPEKAEVAGREAGQHGIRQFPGLDDAVAEVVREDHGELNRTHDEHARVHDGEPALA